jgi:hypothetical protein
METSAWFLREPNGEANDRLSGEHLATLRYSGQPLLEIGNVCVSSDEGGRFTKSGGVGRRRHSKASPSPEGGIDGLGRWF